MSECVLSQRALNRAMLARRRCWSARPRPRDAGAGALPAEVRRHAARPRRPRIFGTKTPQSFSTLVDGRVAGTWRHEAGRIALEPFARLDAADRRAVEQEGERLAELYRP